MPGAGWACVARPRTFGPFGRIARALSLGVFCSRLRSLRSAPQGTAMRAITSFIVCICKDELE